MNTFGAIRHGTLAILFVLVTALGASGASAAAQSPDDGAVDEEVTRQCTFFHYNGGPPYIDEACAIAVQESGAGDIAAVTQLCTFFHHNGGAPYIDDACAATVRAATEEAAGWTDFDSIAIGDQARQTELAKAAAAEEAAGWPDHNPSSIGTV